MNTGYGSLIGRRWLSHGPKAGMGANAPVQTVHADFPHTAYQWSSARSIVRPCPSGQRLRRRGNRLACHRQGVTPTGWVRHMHTPARCPLGYGPELPLQLSHFVARHVVDGVVRSGLAGHSLALTRSISMTTAGTLPSSRVMPHGLRRFGLRLAQRCRVGGGALARWPPSAAQTARADFPHAAFTLMRYARQQSKVSIQSSSPDRTRHTARAQEAVSSQSCATA